MYVDDYGLEALLLCIFQNMTPEQAFEKLERKRKYSKFTEKDLKEMVRMKSKGMTYT